MSVGRNHGSLLTRKSGNSLASGVLPRHSIRSALIRFVTTLPRNMHPRYSFGKWSASYHVSPHRAVLPWSCRVTCGANPSPSCGLPKLWYTAPGMSCVIGLEWQSAVYRLNHGSTAMPNGLTCPRVNTSIRLPSGRNRNVWPDCITTSCPSLPLTRDSFENPWQAYTHPSGISVYELVIPCVSLNPNPVNSSSVLSAFPSPSVSVSFRMTPALDTMHELQSGSGSTPIGMFRLSANTCTFLALPSGPKSERTNSLSVPLPCSAGNG